MVLENWVWAVAMKSSLRVQNVYIQLSVPAGKFGLGQATFQTCLPGGKALICTLFPSLLTDINYINIHFSFVLLLMLFYRPLSILDRANRIHFVNVGAISSKYAPPDLGS